MTRLRGKCRGRIRVRVILGLLLLSALLCLALTLEIGSYGICKPRRYVFAGRVVDGQTTLPLPGASLVLKAVRPATERQGESVTDCRFLWQEWREDRREFIATEHDGSCMFEWEDPYCHVAATHWLFGRRDLTRRPPAPREFLLTASCSGYVNATVHVEAPTQLGRPREHGFTGIAIELAPREAD